MEQRKLTPQMATMYFGAKFVYEGSIGTVRTMGGIDWTLNIIDYPKTDTFRVDKCKLVLTPISEITNEHLTGLIDIGIYSDYFRSKLEYLRKHLEQYVAGVYPTDESDYFNFEDANKLLKYLRSRDYDCDNLIPQGIAVPSK